MQTRALIDHLSRDLEPVRPRTVLSEARILMILVVIELGLYLGARMFRPDIAFAIYLPSFWWKLLSLGLISTVGGTATILSVDPTGTSKGSLRFILGLIATSFLLGWLFCMPDWLPLPASRLNFMQGLHCIYNIFLLFDSFHNRTGACDSARRPYRSRRHCHDCGNSCRRVGRVYIHFRLSIDDPFYIALFYSIGCGAVLMCSRRILKYIAR